MFKIMSPQDAAMLVQDGMTIGVNAFLSLCNPDALHAAIAERFKQTGRPKDLEVFASAGCGGWSEDLFAERYVRLGAVKRIVAGHYGSMPVSSRMAAENKLEAYNIPLGVLSHALRAAASGKSGILSKVGLNLFVDPRVGGAGLNARSTRKLVEYIQFRGEEFLYYAAPRIDIALIKGTTVDPNGNISFEKECLTVDALALAQATHNNNGKVIVQVERVSHTFNRPHSVIVPGILVDAVVVVPEQKQTIMDEAYNPTLSGDIHVPPTHMDYWMSTLRLSGKANEASHEIIGRRAARELKKGNLVNLGIGIPENVGKFASIAGMMNDITLTVESGGIGGLPAPGVSFGATIGADMICDMAEQFDFYDGGGLDICFMGALEADRFGNVNAHKLPQKYAGIGGFANITQATKKVVFCMNFMAKGLKAEIRDGGVHIAEEGSVKKFVKDVAAISFSAKNALDNNQEVLYVTERCVFRLTDSGLQLCEVFDGVDMHSQVLGLLDFEVSLGPDLIR